jgi:hypothetical protein
MNKFTYIRGRKRRQRGYALLFAMFLVATLVILGTAASLVIRTEATRQKEEELVWRGNQYVRAIRLYFRKTGHYPKNLEDLTKYKFGEVRYIRSAYKDPINTDDGSWRLIYMGPNGQLIGSVMKKTLGVVGYLPGMNGPAGTPNGAQNPAPSTQNPPTPQTDAQGSTGQNPPGAPNTPPQNLGGLNPAAQPSASPLQIQPAGQDQVINEGQMMGGSLVGVASKVKKPSIRVYNDGRTYFQWEFIWDPSKSGAPGTPTAPAGSTPAGNPSGIQPPGVQIPPPPPSLPIPPIKQNP